MNIEETREELRRWIDNPHRSKWVKSKTMGAADAYALAVLQTVSKGIGEHQYPQILEIRQRIEALP